MVKELAGFKRKWRNEGSCGTRYPGKPEGRGWEQNEGTTVIKSSPQGCRDGSANLSQKLAVAKLKGQEQKPQQYLRSNVVICETVQ